MSIRSRSQAGRIAIVFVRRAGVRPAIAYATRESPARRPADERFATNAIARSHPLANSASLKFTDLKDESFIINPAVQAEGPPPLWLAEQRRHGLAGRVAAESNSLQEILALVATGRGVCLVPSAVAKHHARAGVRFVPVADADPAVVSLARRPARADPVVEAFIDVAHQEAAAHLLPSDERP